MNLLLDTHTFLWFVNDDPRLSDRFKDLIEEGFVEKEIITSRINLLNIELEHLAR